MEFITGAFSAGDRVELPSTGISRAVATPSGEGPPEQHVLLSQHLYWSDV